jgi:hypothetical protein
MLPKVCRIAVGSAVVFLVATAAGAAPIRTLPNLVDISFYESTFAVTPNPFLPGSPALLTRLADPLSDTNNDFFYFPQEDYDVYYSTSNGTQDVDGSFLTIDAVWRGDVNTFNGSMNITGVQLNFSSGPSLLADSVSFFQMGSSCPLGCTPGSEALAVDGDLSFGTIPRFGGTSSTNLNERLRLTVGFSGISGDPSTTVPEPSSLLLLGTGIVATLRRRRSRL